MRRGEKTPADLDRPAGNDLQSNYEKHDIGHAECVERLQGLGYEVTEWGIDMRDDGGDDGIIYDDKMDFKVWSGEHLVALVDVKTKGSPKYMGRFNERHYVHYDEHAEAFDVPVFIVMFQVDYKTDTVYDEFVFEVGRGDVLTSSDSDAVRSFPDGNDAALVPHEHRKPWEYLETRIT